MAADTSAWERAVLQHVEGQAALHLLAKVAAIDPRQPREAWHSPAVRQQLADRRHLLFAFARRMRHAHLPQVQVAIVYEVLAWMLLASDTPFSARHRREFVTVIQRDPTFVSESALSRIPRSSPSRFRAESLHLLLAEIRNQDTSRYVSLRPKGIRAWWKRRREGEQDDELAAFVDTELPTNLIVRRPPPGS
ncbi:MAG: hypothetical protein U1F10_16475 [Burkholderiales bacterium]